MKMTIKSFLMQELTKRQTRNSSYSLRAFARDLGIGVTTLSDVMADKRSLSKTNLEKVSIKLMLSPMELEQVWQEYKQNYQKTFEVDEHDIVDEDTFRVIGDWKHLAILNLAKIPSNQAGKPSWIAKRLGITTDEAFATLERLLRMKLVKKSGSELIRTSKPLATTNNIPSMAIRKYHAENLWLAETSLHNDDVNCRKFIATTLAINPENIPRATELMIKTRKKIEEMLEEGPVSEVYTVSFQMFPLTKLQTTKGDKK
ncbi:hypothetical protein CIK05_03510 [Bdellovibrio sp. qaytius]|nr:hypothetical protein CIK05_03510 [Bdellovibrio sp. qaytius]